MEFKEIDGYLLLRKIGEGAYGKVYLVKNKALNEDSFFALKLLDRSLQNREVQAIEKLSKISQKANLVPIIKMGFIEGNFYYIMPLADTLKSSLDFEPTDFRWQEMSLAKEINRRLENPSIAYFSPEEILKIISPIFDSVELLGENALLHRDIKPENILFLGDNAHLADFGLVEDDKRNISQIGTPFYLAPSWYLNKGGNPDVYGLATTFYSLITSNYPDTIGRAAYRFPEKLNDNIDDNTKEQYLHWHRCILRAIAENPADRYTQVSDFKKAIFDKNFENSKAYSNKKTTQKETHTKKLLYTAVAIILPALCLFFINTQKEISTKNPRLKADESIFKDISKNGYIKSTYEILSEQKWREKQEAILKEMLAVYKEYSEKQSYDESNFLPKDTQEAKRKSFLNSQKESIITMQDRLSDKKAYRLYLEEEYLRIEKLLKKEDSLNDLIEK